MGIAWAVLQGKLDLTNELAKRIYACTTCGYCSARCSMNITSIIEAFRADVVNVDKKKQAEIAPLPAQKKWGDHVKKEHNPYLEKHADRTKWLASEIKREMPKKAEYVYFVGCTSSYRQKKIARDTVEVFRKLKLDFTILEDEWCCSSPMFRTGQWEPVRKIVQHNVDITNKAEADAIITTCAGCYKTWKIDYTDTYKDLVGVEFDFKVVHTTQLLANLIKKGESELEKEFKKKVTYHDPCHLGRHAEVYDPPREVLRAIPGLELVEMPRNREWATCCGAGGGFKSGFRKESIKMARTRIEEAAETGAEALTSSCPFCWGNFREAIQANESKMELYDIVEIVNKTVRERTK